MVSKRICGTFLAALLCASGVRVQAADTAGGLGKNAALQYWPAFNWLPHDEAELKQLADWKTIPIDAKVEKFVSDRESLKYLHAGANIGQCDWGLDLSQGPYLLLMHLNKIRVLTQLSGLKIRVDLAQKKWAAAVDDGADLMTASRQVARPPVMISLLVSYACERDAIDTMAKGLNSLDPPSLEQLSQRLDALPSMPSQAESLKLESKLTLDWTIQHVKNAGPNPDWHKVLEFMELGNDGKPPQKPVIELVKESGGNSEGVEHQLEGLLSFYEEGSKLVDAGLTQAEFAKRSQELGSRYSGNPFATPILPNLTAAHDSVIAARTRMFLFKTAIGIVQHGPDAAKGIKDPINHEPVAFEKRADGFQLTSRVMLHGQPVALVVGTIR